MLRRDGILFRRGVIPALVLSILLAAAAAGAGFSVTQSAGEGAPRAALVVVDEENTLLRLRSTSKILSRRFQLFFARRKTKKMPSHSWGKMI